MAALQALYIPLVPLPLPLESSLVCPCSLFEAVDAAVLFRNGALRRCKLSFHPGKLPPHRFHGRDSGHIAKGIQRYQTVLLLLRCCVSFKDKGFLHPSQLLAGTLEEIPVHWDSIRDCLCIVCDWL